MTMTMTGLRFSIRRLIKSVTKSDHLTFSSRVRVSHTDERSLFIKIEENDSLEETFDVCLEVSHAHDDQCNKSMTFVDAFCDHTGMDKSSYVGIRVGVHSF